MTEDLNIIKTLKIQGFSNIEIDQIVNYLETLDYDLTATRYIGKIISTNERLAKYFFLRDTLKMEIHSSGETFHINEILDQCTDWSEFWRLLVIKKGFCCIRIPISSANRNNFVFLAGPNILSSVTADIPYSIYEDIDY